MNDNEQVDNDPADAETPLEKVKQQQAQMQNKEVEEQRVDADAEIPGHSIPSEIRKHPQRTQY